MSKRSRQQNNNPRALNLARSRKRREWEFFNLRHHRDQVSELLRAAEHRNELELVEKHKAELELIEQRGAEILKDQVHYLRVFA